MLRRWRDVAGSTALLVACACTTQDETRNDPGWWITSASASATGASATDGGTGPATTSDSGTDGSGHADTGSASPGTGETGGPQHPDAGSDSDPTAPTSGTSGSPGGDPVLEQCLDIAVDACESCGCQQCLEPLLACEMNTGCVAIRECAQLSGCTDTSSCYEACEDVINAQGGVLGQSAALAAELSECMEASCAICF